MVSDQDRHPHQGRGDRFPGHCSSAILFRQPSQRLAVPQHLQGRLLNTHRLVERSPRRRERLPHTPRPSQPTSPRAHADHPPRRSHLHLPPLDHGFREGERTLGDHWRGCPRLVGQSRLAKGALQEARSRRHSRSVQHRRFQHRRQGLPRRLP